MSSFCENVIFMKFSILFLSTGNGFVLYGSIRHNALKIERISLLFVQNIAMSDILITLCYYLPILVTLFTQRWVFGSTMCFISGFYLRSSPFDNEVLVFGAFSLYRLWILKKPKRSRDTISTAQVSIVMIVICIIALTLPTLLVTSNLQAKYRPEYLNCVSDAYKEAARSQTSMLINEVFLYCSHGLVFFTNIVILTLVIKQAVYMKKAILSSVATLMTITWVYILSYLPVFIRIGLLYQKYPVPSWFYYFQMYVMSIPVVINPIIYTINCERFRTFIKACLCLPVEESRKGEVVRSVMSGMSKQRQNYFKNPNAADSVV